MAQISAEFADRSTENKHPLGEDDLNSHQSEKLDPALEVKTETARQDPIPSGDEKAAARVSELNENLHEIHESSRAASNKTKKSKSRVPSKKRKHQDSDVESSDHSSSLHK